MVDQIWRRRQLHTAELTRSFRTVQPHHVHFKFIPRAQRLLAQFASVRMARVRRQRRQLLLASLAISRHFP